MQLLQRSRHLVLPALLPCSLPPHIMCACVRSGRQAGVPAVGLHQFFVAAAGQAGDFGRWFVGTLVPRQYV